MKRSFALALAAFTLGTGLTSTAVAQSSDQPAALPKKKQLAPQPTVSSLEIAGTFGPTVVFGEAANPEYVQTFSRTGAYGELAIAYRSSYFVDPFISVGYGTLASGESRIPAGPYGAGGNVGQHLGAWVISPGITSDIWRFRPRLGLGLAIVQQKFEFRGETHSSSQKPLATQLGLGFNAFDDDRFRLDLEARAILISGADVNFVTLDAVLRGDLFYFIKK